MAGNFAVWGGLFTIFDCSLAHIRRTEDAWNAIAAGAITGGLLAARGTSHCASRPSCMTTLTNGVAAGPKAIVRSAVVGAALLAVIEGLSLFIQRKIAEYQKDMARKQWEAIHGKGAALDLEDHLDPPVAPPVWHGDALPGDAGAAGIQGLDYGVDRA